MTHSNNINDEQLQKRAREAFDQQVDSLEISTLHRLQAARQKALSLQRKQSWLSSTRRSTKWLTGAGAGLALASVLTFMVAPDLLQSNKLSPLDDLEMLSAEAEIDLYTQLEFYEWLGDALDDS